MQVIVLVERFVKFNVLKRVLEHVLVILFRANAARRCDCVFNTEFNESVVRAVKVAKHSIMNILVPENFR
jgi:hypothetical protein